MLFSDSVEPAVEKISLCVHRSNSLAVLLGQHLSQVLQVFLSSTGFFLRRRRIPCPPVRVRSKDHGVGRDDFGLRGIEGSAPQRGLWTCCGRRKPWILDSCHNLLLEVGTPTTQKSDTMTSARTSQRAPKLLESPTDAWTFAPVPN
jgi:hypothetical protein